MKVWNAASGKLLGTLREHTDVVESVARSPDGKRLAKCDGHDVVVWGYVKQPANSLQSPERD